MEEKEAAPKQNQTTTIMFVVIVLFAFALGVMWQKINVLEKGGGGATSTPAATAVAGTRLASGKMTADQAKKIPSVSDKDHVRGADEAQIYLIEYSDFECPFCKNYHETVKQLLDEYGNKMAWVYRQFPIEQLHKQAWEQSMASECVAKLGGNGAFWKFADKVYAETTSNDGLDLAKMPDYAVAAGVNKAEFQKCLDNEETRDFVQAQYQGGLTAGITGTPGSFIVNKKGEAWFVPGAMPYANFKQMIDTALASN